MSLHDKVEAVLATEGTSLAEPPHPVLEIDGPPRTYFEVSDGTMNGWPSHEMQIMRFVYRTIRVTGDTEDAVRTWMDAALAEIRAWCAQHDVFIFWRARPHFEETYQYSEFAGPQPPTPEDRDKKIWTARCRLITSHPMPEEIWAKYEAKQNQEPHRV